jgi:hypothetical protein
LEWARLNNEYFDYANFVRENKLSHFTAKMICKRVAKLKWSIFKNFLFITTCYAYQWTFSMPETTKMIIYRLKTKHLMEYYYYLYCFAKKIKKPK